MFGSIPLRKLRGSCSPLLLIWSCHRQSGPIDQKQTNLSWLGSMYAMYVSQNQGRPPKTIDDLRKYVEKTTEC